jgi:hypothetical protein
VDYEITKIPTTQRTAFGFGYHQSSSSILCIAYRLLAWPAHRGRGAGVMRCEFGSTHTVPVRAGMERGQHSGHRPWSWPAPGGNPTSKKC